jgi:hypothetical protein
MRLQLAQHHLSKAFNVLKRVHNQFLVPQYKTMNALIEEVIFVALRPPSSSLRPRQALIPTANKQPPGRSYHTSIAPRPAIRPAQIIRLKERTWLSRLLEWRKAEHIAVSTHNIIQLVARHLNHNNIQPSTLSLMIRVSTLTAQPFLPWQIAQRALNPKALVRKLQEALVGAACECSVKGPRARHIWLSRGMVALTRVEGMGIVPSRESLLVVLRAAVRDGNVSGARALLERMTRLGYPGLQSSEAAELVKLMPSPDGMGTMSFATGDKVSSLYIHLEQLQFLHELRQYIVDPTFIGPYLRALGQLGATAPIWDEWNHFKGTRLKDGLITSFVEGFLEAHEPAAALEFVKLASKHGYPLNFIRARKIIVAFSRTQASLGLDLITEIMGSTAVWEEKGFMGVVMRFVSIQTGSSAIGRGRVGELMLVAKQLAEVKRGLAHGTDYDAIIEELERILPVRKRGRPKKIA